ncbi:MAG: lysine exporter LysO family protein [bacterium]|nr:lysine exporter LysO family protein [bacterium]MDD7722064.1 lysine exporter LysO family protein [bacterium]MDY4102028.1 lysine exporter LysO family protein [Parabacteroides sp.]
MKGSLIVVACFTLGCLLGWSGQMPTFLLSEELTTYVLYLLMFQVGLSIGSDKKLKEILSSIRPKLLWVPLATIVGTLSAVACVSLLLPRWSLFDCLAVGSGFAYYSLSSILITQLKEPTLGVQLATELGTIALMANIIREIMALLGAPLFVRYFGRLAPICAGGATTMDTTLPIITRYSGKDLVFISIFHGILVDFSVPFLVSFWCSFS